MTEITSLILFEMEVETRSNSNAPASLGFMVDEDTPIDLTGIAFKLQLRYPRTSRAVPLEATTANNTLLVGGVDNNYLTFAFTLEQMNLLPPGNYLFDLLAVADGLDVVVSHGTWTHILGITRS